MGLVSDIRSDGIAGLEHNFLTGQLEDLIRWARRRSSWPATFGLACCAIEMMATGGAHYDMARYGMEVFRASPRQADIMIVAGRVSQKMAPILRNVYDQMVEPKWVISMGVCASTGGMFNNYALVQGVDTVVPVDVYAPGCPPGPETLMQAIVTLHGLIETGEILRRRESTGSGAQVHLAQDPGSVAPSATRPVPVAVTSGPGDQVGSQEAAPGKPVSHAAGGERASEPEPEPESEAQPEPEVQPEPEAHPRGYFDAHPDRGSDGPR